MFKCKDGEGERIENNTALGAAKILAGLKIQVDLRRPEIRIHLLII